MDVVQVYRCLCDLQRLRVLALLEPGPLCVCHLLEILGADPVRLSKQLAYLRRQGLITARRRGSWMVYRLGQPAHPILTRNLLCLRDLARDHAGLQSDARQRAALLQRLAAGEGDCPEEVLSSAPAPRRSPRSKRAPST